jgi:signal transduction histidine kinase
MNTGVEIPASECDRIFDKFYRIPSHDPWKHGGTGLGLALVKRMLECLQGTIQVTSAHNCVTFTLHLPLVPEENNSRL